MQATAKATAAATAKVVVLKLFVALSTIVVTAIAHMPSGFCNQISDFSALDQQIDHALKAQYLVLGANLNQQIPLAVKVLGIEDKSSKSCFDDKLADVVRQRIADAKKKHHRHLTARQEALAVLKMPGNTSSKVLKLRLSLLDRVLNEMYGLDPRFGAHQAVTYFQWFPHAS